MSEKLFSNTSTGTKFSIALSDSLVQICLKNFNVLIIAINYHFRKSQFTMNMFNSAFRWSGELSSPNVNNADSKLIFLQLYLVEGRQTLWKLITMMMVLLNVASASKDFIYIQLYMY